MFFAFDLVWLDGEDLRNVPLIERKTKLKKLIQGSSQILYAQHIEKNGKLLFQETVERNLEGIVAKRRTGTYTEHGWLKIKNPKYTQSEGRHDMFQSFRAPSKKF